MNCRESLPPRMARTILLRFIERGWRMASQERPRRIVRFGEFETDLDSGELFKNGLKVRLQEQPFQFLAILLECPGEVVSREDLRRRLWPDDTYVDFDRSLNTAASKLRDA